jgi:hypothetical protein
LTVVGPDDPRGVVDVFQARGLRISAQHAPPPIESSIFEKSDERNGINRGIQVFSEYDNALAYENAARLSSSR